MPDLGQYAGEVLLAYGVSLAVLGILIWASVARARAMRRALNATEARMAEAKDGA